MAVTFDTLPVYSMLGDGRLVQTNTYTDDGSDKYYVGGKIFYIDPTATGGTYTFYTKTGKVMTDVRVGDEPYAYKATGTPNKEKYYIFNSNLVLRKAWTYQTGDTWIYNFLGTTNSIGSGKTNTNTVKAADGGAYENFDGNIWNSLKSINNNSDKGCNDWFIPSSAEMDALRLARDRDGNALTNIFSNTYMWSSVETNAYDAHFWGYDDNAWTHYNKYGNNAVLFARSF